MAFLGLTICYAVAFVVFTDLILTRVSSAPSNITIDDSSPDPLTGAQIVYGPQNSNVTWNIGQDCASCFVRLDPSRAFDETWHDGTFFPGGPALTATVSFTGTAVYVYGILVSECPAQFIAGLSTSQLTFQINGTDVGSYSNTCTAGDSTTYDYNIPFFIQDNLPGKHNLAILNGGGSSESLLLLDRIIYTSNTDGLVNAPKSLPPDNLNPSQSSPGASASSTVSTSTGFVGRVPTSESPAASIATGTSVESATSGMSSLSTPQPSPSSTPERTPVSVHSRRVSVIVSAVVVPIIVIFVLASIWVWMRRHKRSRAAMLSSVSPRTVVAVGEGSEDDPPEYTPSAVETNSQPQIDAGWTHLNSFGNAGTKELIASLVDASTAPHPQPHNIA